MAFWQNGWRKLLIVFFWPRELAVWLWSVDSLVYYICIAFSDHHFSGMESWLNQHKTVIGVGGWNLGEKDASDDRLGDYRKCWEKVTTYRRVSYPYGTTPDKRIWLPTGVGRYDTTSFNVYHNVGIVEKGFQFWP